MIDRHQLAELLDKETPDPLLEQIKSLLAREDTRLVASRSSTVSVSEARNLWKTRLQNTDITGLELHGVESFLERLSGLTQQRRLQQFALIGSENSGHLFFECANHQFVGAIVFDARPHASRQA